MQAFSEKNTFFFSEKGSRDFALTTPFAAPYNELGGTYSRFRLDWN